MLSLYKNILLVSLLSASLNAEILLEEINSKPASRAKNFMIWQYLKQDITPLQADKAYSQILGNHYKLNKEYLKKSSNKELEYKIECSQKTDLLKIEDEKCLEIAFTPYKTLKMSNEQRDLLAKEFDSNQTKELLKILNEPNTQEAYSTYAPEIILKMFTSSGMSFRRESLNMKLSKSFVNRLADSSRMSQFISMVVRDSKLDNLQASLLQIDADKVDSGSNFLLALLSLENMQKDKALAYLQISHDKTTKRMDKDKTLFWMYLVSKDKSYLNKLLLSMDINVYSLHAHDILGTEVVNYFTTTEVKDKLSKQNLEDPFEWDEILAEIRSTPKDKLFDLSKKFEYKNMIPVKTFVLEQAYSFHMHGFIMPYERYLADLPLDEKAFVYSIMRQESNYIPSALSRSFALGLMQLMPFLVDHLAKEQKEKVEYKDMFIPEKNIQYSLKHLEWMRKSLSHPLFIAYAYNGGTGFLRRHLKTGAFQEGAYEPYFSMEMMGNSQSREYGKKVISNYVMYKKILGEDISIVDLLDKVVRKKKTQDS